MKTNVPNNPAYPSELLPTLRHRYPLEADSFPESDKTIMHRRSDIASEECFYDGIIDIINFRLDRFGDIVRTPFNLSLNMLGGKFDVKNHALWRQTKPGNDYWSGESDINITDYSGCYYRHTTAYPDFFFRVSDLHNKLIKYPRTFNNSSEGWAYKAVVNGLRLIDNDSGHKKIKGAVTENINAILKLKHRPTNLNYWHWQLEAYTLKKIHLEGDETKELIVLEPLQEKNKSSKWAKNLLASQQEHLLSVIMLECPDHYIFEEDYYIRTNIEKSEK